MMRLEPLTDTPRGCDAKIGNPHQGENLEGRDIFYSPPEPAFAVSCRSVGTSPLNGGHISPRKTTHRPNATVPDISHSGVGSKRYRTPSPVRENDPVLPGGYFPARSSDGRSNRTRRNGISAGTMPDMLGIGSEKAQIAKSQVRNLTLPSLPPEDRNASSIWETTRARRSSRESARSTTRDICFTKDQQRHKKKDTDLRSGFSPSRYKDALPASRSPRVRCGDSSATEFADSTLTTSRKWGPMEPRSSRRHGHDAVSLREKSNEKKNERNNSSSRHRIGFQGDNIMYSDREDIAGGEYRRNTVHGRSHRQTPIQNESIRRHSKYSSTGNDLTETDHVPHLRRGEQAHHDGPNDNRDASGTITFVNEAEFPDNVAIFDIRAERKPSTINSTVSPYGLLAEGPLQVYDDSNRTYYHQDRGNTDIHAVPSCPNASSERHRLRLSQVTDSRERGSGSRSRLGVRSPRPVPGARRPITAIPTFSPTMPKDGRHTRALYSLSGPIEKPDETYLPRKDNGEEYGSSTSATAGGSGERSASRPSSQVSPGSVSTAAGTPLRDTFTVAAAQSGHNSGCHFGSLPDHRVSEPVQPVSVLKNSSALPPTGNKQFEKSRTIQFKLGLDLIPWDNYEKEQQLEKAADLQEYEQTVELRKMEQAHIEKELHRIFIPHLFLFIGALGSWIISAVFAVVARYSWWVAILAVGHCGCAISSAFGYRTLAEQTLRAQPYIVPAVAYSSLVVVLGTVFTTSHSTVLQIISLATLFLGVIFYAVLSWFSSVAAGLIARRNEQILLRDLMEHPKAMNNMALPIHSLEAANTASTRSLGELSSNRNNRVGNRKGRKLFNSQYNTGNDLMVVV